MLSISVWLFLLFFFCFVEIFPHPIVIKFIKV